MVEWKTLIKLIKKQKRRKSSNIHTNKEGKCKFCNITFNDLDKHMEAKHKNQK